MPSPALIPGGPTGAETILAPVLERLADPLAVVLVDDLPALWREAIVTLTCPRPADFDAGPSLSGRLRGALGRALMTAPARADGLPRAFDLLYRTDAPTYTLREWPRPILLTGEAADHGRAVVIRLRVFGFAIAWLEDLMPALLAGLAAGLSVAPGARARARLSPEDGDVAVLEGLPAVPGPEDGVEDGAEAITLRFDTPLVVDHRGALVTEGGPLVRSIIRRVAGLAAWMDVAVAGAEAGATPDAGPAPAAGPALSALADAVEADASGQRIDGWTRYSIPQGRKAIDVTGLVGPVTLRGPLGPLLPWLVLGQRTHAGRRAIFGLGRYTLEGVEGEVARRYSPKSDAISNRASWNVGAPSLSTICSSRSLSSGRSRST